MDRALAWPPGSLRKIAETGDIPQTSDTPPGDLASGDPTNTLGGSSSNAELNVVSLGPLVTKGLTAEQLAEVKLIAELAALQAARKFREADEQRARGDSPHRVEDAAP